jgi:hypothetical protein
MTTVTRLKPAGHCDPNHVLSKKRDQVVADDGRRGGVSGLVARGARLVPAGASMFGKGRNVRNAGVEDEIKGSLDRLGEALSAGDLAGVASCWEIPGLVLSDAGAIPVVDRPQIEAFFGHAVASYRSQGLVATRPELERTVALTDRWTSPGSVDTGG